jgi:hypothetical protein
MLARTVGRSSVTMVRPLLGAASVRCKTGLAHQGRKLEYVKYLKAACNDPDSAERIQLDQFLTRCFLDADTDFDGKVRWPTFNFLIDTAVSNPRHFGLIASRAERYASVEEMDANRKEMFKDIDHNKHGFIRLHDWLEFYHSYFGTKLAGIDTEKMGSTIGSEKHNAFLIAACTARTNPEYKEFFRFCFACFQQGDPQGEGLVTMDGFDKMIELSKPVLGDVGSGKALFDKINTDHAGGVSFDQWLDYSYQTICEKAQKLDSSLSGKPPATVREGVILE